MIRRQSEASAVPPVRDENEIRCPDCGKRAFLETLSGPRDSALLLIGTQESGTGVSEAQPFPGPAGQLLDRMLQAIGLSREQVRLGTLGCCQGATSGTSSQGAFLDQELQAHPSQFVVALGDLAQRLLSPAPVLRGQPQPFRDGKIIFSFHPEDLLKNAELKREAWEHLKVVAKELGLTLPARKP